MRREYALEQSWAVIEELAEDDRGASGASFELPQLAKVRQIVRNGEFDVLVVREIDRLSRKLAKQLVVEEELSRTGVQIPDVPVDYDDSPIAAWANRKHEYLLTGHIFCGSCGRRMNGHSGL